MSDPATFVPATTWQNLSSGGVQVTPILSVPNESYLAPAGGQNGLTGTTQAELIWVRGGVTLLDGFQQFLVWDELSVQAASGHTVFNPWAAPGTPGRWKSASIVTLPGLLTDSVVYYNGTSFATNVGLQYTVTQLTLRGRFLLNKNAVAAIDDPDPTSPLRVAAQDGSNAFAWMYSAGVGVSSGLVGATSRGTLTAPTASQSGDILLTLGGGGYGATTWKYGAGGFSLYALGNWTDTQQGTRAVIATVAQAAALPAINRIDVRLGLTVNTGAGALPAGGDPGAGSINLAGTLQFNGVGIAGNVPATATNDNAAAGNVGEQQRATATGVALVTGVAKDIVTLLLGAGDWDVYGNVTFTPAGTTTVTQVLACSNTVANTSITDESMTSLVTTLTTGAAQIIPVGQKRYSLSAPTTVRIIGLSTFGTSTMSAGGVLVARRRR